MAVSLGYNDPLTQFALDSSQAGISQTQNPVLIVAQTINAQPMTLYPCTSVAQARSFAGRGSYLSRMFEAYFANDQIGPIYLLPLADNGTSKATGTLTLTGTATANGTLFLYIAGQLVVVGVVSGATPTVMAAAIVAAITAAPDLPVTASSAVGVVTFTAKNAGTLGNLINLQMNFQSLGGQQALPAGVSVAIVAMSGGATDPITSGIAAILGDTPMRLLIHPFAANSTSMSDFATLMNASTGRWSPTRGDMGHCFSAISGTTSALQTYGPTNNDQNTTVFAYEAGSPTPPWEAAAIWAGAQAASFRNQPNAPTTGLPLIGFSAPPSGLAEASGGAFQKSTRNTLEGMGLSTAKYPVGGAVISLSVTTYQTNTYGQASQAYFWTQTMFTLMAIQDYIAEWETTVFAQTLVADNGTKFGPGIKFTTPQLFMAGMIDLYNQMQYAGLVEDAAPFIAASSATRNLAYPGEMDVLWAPYLVVGLYQITNTIQFRTYSALAAAAAATASSGNPVT